MLVSLPLRPINHKRRLRLLRALRIPIPPLHHLARLDHLMPPASNLPRLSPNYFDDRPGSKAPHLPLPADVTDLRHHLGDVKHRSRQ